MPSEGVRTRSASAAVVNMPAAKTAITAVVVAAALEKGEGEEVAVLLIEGDILPLASLLACSLSAAEGKRLAWLGDDDDVCWCCCCCCRCCCPVAKGCRGERLSGEVRARAWAAGCGLCPLCSGVDRFFFFLGKGLHEGVGDPKKMFKFRKEQYNSVVDYSVEVSCFLYIGGCAALLGPFKPHLTVPAPGPG